MQNCERMRNAKCQVKNEVQKLNAYINYKVHWEKEYATEIEMCIDGLKWGKSKVSINIQIRIIMYINWKQCANNAL